ncbi:type I restriction endonuclease [Parasutterella sp.]
MIMTGSLFKSEAEFEKALINTLKNKGWKGDVFYRPTEKDLIENWKKIIFENNRDVLHGVPLSDSEMDQILKQVDSSPLPLDKNLFINGSSMSILRDNPEAPQLSEYVSLVIFDHNQIAGGRSRYQIAEQPIFEGDVSKKERGDIMLLINGMPVIHIELKANSIDIHDAKNQIQRYLRHGIFSKGIFSLVQFFVAMNPNEMSYFAHPGSKPINPKFVFHWADEKNNIVSDWRKIAEDFLSIPMAHKMVGFFTVADRGDNILKVMRSYQYYAADGISHRYYEEEKKNEVYVDNYRKGG